MSRLTKFLLIVVPVVVAAAVGWNQWASNHKLSFRDTADSNSKAKTQDAPLTWHTLQEWIVGNGGTAKRARLTEVTENDPSNLASPLTSVEWVATEDIPSGASYLAVPGKLVLSPSVGNRSRCLPVMKLIRTQYQRIVPPYYLRAMETYVVVQFERFVEGTKSFWAPYLSSFPATLTDLPIFFGENDKAVLRTLPQGGPAFAAYFDGMDTIAKQLAQMVVSRPTLLEFYRTGGVKERGEKVLNAEVDTEEESDRLHKQFLWAIGVVHKFALDNRFSSTPPYELMLIPGVDVLPQTEDINAHGDVIHFLTTVDQEKSATVQFRSVHLTASRERRKGDRLHANIVSGGSGMSEQSCLIDFVLSHGIIPNSPVFDCFYFQLKHTPFEGDHPAEASRMKLLEGLADEVRKVNATLIELKFRSTETVAERIVKCFGLMLLRPFHFLEGAEGDRSRADALAQLHDFSSGRVIASLTHLQTSMKAFFEDFIAGGNVTDRTFRLVYKLQERSERAANRVLATLKQVKA